MRLLSATMLLVCLVPTLSPAGDENPYEKAKVGDWVEYKYTGKDWRAPEWEGKIKMTVVARDAKELTYAVDAVYWSKSQLPRVIVPTRKIKIDLTKPHDPIAREVLGDLLNNAALKEKDIKTTKLGEGKERIKIGSKEYDTRWVETKYTIAANDPNNIRKPYVITAKAWISKDVPLTGLVMLEKSDASQSKMVLVGSGSGGK
jgi:hypothetical protein